MALGGGGVQEVASRRQCKGSGKKKGLKNWKHGVKGRGKKKGVKNWTHGEKDSFFKSLGEAQQLRLPRGKVVWNHVSDSLKKKLKIHRTPQACINLWDTSKRGYGAIRKHGPRYWKMGEKERSEHGLPRSFKRTCRGLVR